MKNVPPSELDKVSDNTHNFSALDVGADNTNRCGDDNQVSATIKCSKLSTVTSSFIKEGGFSPHFLP